MVKATSHKVERTPLPQQLVDWLQSESGRGAVASSVQKSQSEVKNLNNARKVDPERLLAPITL